MENTTGMRIRQWRESKKMDVPEFARASGLKPSAVYGLESDANRPSFDTIRSLRHAFPDLSTDWLIDGQGPMLRDARVLVPAAPPEPPADFSTAAGTEAAAYLLLLKEQVADLKDDKRRLLVENDGLRSQNKVLLGKSSPSTDAAGPWPTDPQRPVPVQGFLFGVSHRVRDRRSGQASVR